MTGENWVELVTTSIFLIGLTVVIVTLIRTFFK